MGSHQKYSLRWNDFSVNVATTFRDLHSRQDFVDVTLACADGSTLDAHKVILSSVSTYFRDILKNAPCKHPIIILKDTCREEASAMLEFAYTGEVNVGQDLLPSLLHTAKCFKIKGLDNVQTPPGLLDLNTSHSNDHESEHWGGSRPPTRSHTPSTRPHTPQTRSHTPSTRPHTPQSHPHSPNSVQSTNDKQLPDQTQDVKPFADHNSDIKPFSDHFLSAGPGTARATSGSRPPTRPSSPLHNARTPPPKRWKRSFDMARGEDCDDNGYSHSNGSGGMEYGEPGAKRFCDAKRFSTDSERRFAEADSNTRRFAEPRPITSYPHSMPASPTMLDARNFNSLGLLRHLAGLEGPREAHENSRIDQNSRHEDSLEQDALDYRFQVADQSQGEKEKARHERLAFRPESAPTVLDMSPDGSRLSMDGLHKHDDEDRLAHFRSVVAGNLQQVSSGADSLTDCLNKSLGSCGGSGRYSCDECGKLFRHPGSLQHHRHIHRGTHRCPSCGKAFSRRWDMERHLNKSKYGCPANRFSSPGSQGAASPPPHPLLTSPPPHPLLTSPPSHSLLTILPHNVHTN